MICAECQKDGKTSRVTPEMYCSPYYDEQGKEHHHGYSSTCAEYTCSNGHSWFATGVSNCWCGWKS